MADEEQVPEVVKTSSGNRNPIVSILLVVNAIFLAVVGFFQYQIHEREKKRPSIKDVVRAQMKRVGNESIDGGGEDLAMEEDDSLLLPLETFTANLAQGDGPRRYLRLNPVLRFSGDSKDDEFRAKRPQIRDAIISIINSKRPEDLLKIEGKAFLKEEIKASINSFLIDGHVEDIYYVGFQIN